jgi:two-component system, OmpR family, heavy metal sensor histidine kinase CusS
VRFEVGAWSKGSLGTTLSKWLAIQAFVGLSLICIGVYIVIALALSQRQDTTLDQKQDAVRSILMEGNRRHSPEELQHLLRDVLAGHAEMSLRIKKDPGGIFAAHGATASGPEHSGRRLKLRSFEVDVEASAAGQPPGTVSLELVLDPKADDALLSFLAGTLGCAALFGSIVVSYGAFRLVRKGMLPIHRLVEQTRALTVNELERRLDGTGQPTELQPLIEQFNELLHRLSDAYRQMEAFNADVAHELNTPLSNLISSCELTLRRERSADDMREVLGSNLEDLRRMAGIVADMLFLSMADRAPNIRRAPIESLSALVHEVIEYHEASIQEEGLKTEVRGDSPASVDERLLRRAISNLLGNATRYAERDSTITIEIQRLVDGVVSIGVSNLGPTIEAEHLPRLFDRFYRVDPARAYAERNHGLGLSIVAAIARMHGGTTFARSGYGATSIGLTLNS